MAKMNEKEKAKNTAKVNEKDSNLKKKESETTENETLENPAFELEEGQTNANTDNSVDNTIDEDVLKAKDKQIDDLLDQVKRTMAEFDNYRKRTEKEKSQMYSSGEKNALESLLPVIDNFERALSSVSEEEKSNSFVKGIDMIYKQLMTTLESLGVKEIEAVGKPFDPNIHNAVMHEENEDYGENIVVEQFLKGYMYKDTVLRYSMVKVVN